MDGKVRKCVRAMSVSKGKRRPNRDWHNGRVSFIRKK